MYDEEKSYYLVNPSGTVHVVPDTLARIRLGTVGWRLATKDEIALYIRMKGVQNMKHRIAPRWSATPPDVQEMPDVQEVPAKRTTKKAA